VLQFGQQILDRVVIGIVRPRIEPAADKADLSSLTSMLEAKWKKGGASGSVNRDEAPRSGQIRSFRIVKLDAALKRIEVELA